MLVPKAFSQLIFGGGGGNIQGSLFLEGFLRLQKVRLMIKKLDFRSSFGTNSNKYSSNN